MENLYELAEFNPTGISDKKTRIILTETKRDYRNYILSLKYRYNKKNPYLPNYVITKDGEVYNIIKPNEYSNYMVDEEVNKTSIIIALENLGWLKKNTLSDTYVNWIGDIYKEKVFEKKWRDYFFWEPYNKKQMIVLSKLLVELCDNFNIPKRSLGHNVKYDGVQNFKGNVTRSNFDFIYKDTNPSFDFKLLNELLEND
jgi:hypothetical protein